ncbi:MAG: glycosyltransferase family 2 protein [Thermoanaerobaculia bacterium]
MIHIAAAVVFWLCLLVCLYVYFGYPALLWIASRFRTKPVAEADLTPRVSFIVAACNEENVIARKIENTLALDYPAALVEIIIASNGSTDRTNEIVRRFDNPRVRLLVLEKPGKMEALNQAVQLATGEILVFTDADFMLDSHTLRLMARKFADPEVGGVSGARKPGIVRKGDATGEGEGLYVRWDRLQKILESRIGSVYAADGLLYAIRSTLYVPLDDPNRGDDMTISTQVPLAGYRLLFEPRATAWEESPIHARSEFRRKARIANRCTRALLGHGRRLFTAGFYTVEVLSHKVLRHAIPFFLIPMFCASVVLAPHRRFYAIALTGQVVVYALGLAGAALRNTSAGYWKVFSVPYYFCFVNAAAFVGLLQWMTGRGTKAWTTRALDSAPHRDRDGAAVGIDPASALRVGIVVDGTMLPAWIRRVIEHVRSTHHLTRVVFSPTALPREPFLARLLGRIDRALFARRSDGLTTLDATELLAGVPTDGEVDVLLAFAPCDERSAWRIELEGLEAFVARRPVMTARIRTGDGVIATTDARTDPISFRRGRSRLAWRAAAMIEHALRAAPLPRPAESGSPAESLTGFRLVRSAGRSFSTLLSQTYRDRYTHEQWGIAFSWRKGAWHHIVPPKDRLWSDPFVVADGDRAWVFVEEMLFAEGRGGISVLEIHADGSWTEPRRVLERPYHLSYPCVVRWNGTFHMLPETREHGTLELYRCTRFPDQWELDTVLMDVAAVDGTLFEVAGRWWLYLATDSGDGAGFDRLWLHHAPAPHGPWSGHIRNPLECTVIGGRPAGRPFIRDGRLVRATQIGTPSYGRAMQLREIVTLTADEWLERHMETISPDWAPGIEGTHTLNVDGDYVVTDALRILSKT